jgi:hypothetical protein
MDPRRRPLGQSQHIVHNPGAEGRVLVVTVAQADHKPLREEATASGCGVSDQYINTVLGKHKISLTGPWGNQNLEDSIP